MCLFSIRTVDFEGYSLPPNTHVVPLLHAIHMNPDHWSEPEAFQPERFLNADHTEVVKPAHFIPFGVGQRMCIGDQMAEKEFFLLFASMLHSFDIRVPKSCSELPSLKGFSAVTVTPNAFEIECSPRNVAALGNAIQDLANNNELADDCRMYNGYRG